MTAPPTAPTASATPTVADLADSLGVSADALHRLGVSRDGSGWLIPERNADGEIIGHATRGDDGKKRCRPGSKRGLTMAWPLGAYDGSTPDDPILIVEGMSDTAAGLDLRFTTIGRPGAHGGAEHLKALLADRHVAIMGENDQAGRLGAAGIAEAVADVVASLRVVYPPEGIKDLRAWLLAGATAPGLLAAIQATEPHEPSEVEGAEIEAPDDEPGAGLVVRCAADIETRHVDWLWRPILVAGAVNLLVGLPDIGKGVCCSDIAARITTGTAWPPIRGERVENKAGAVVILSMEDSPETTIVPRLRAAGADLAKVLIVEGVNRLGEDGEKIRDAFDIQRDALRLEKLRAVHADLRLAIIDPLDSYINAKVDTNIGNKARAALWPLKTWAESSGVTVLIVHHFSKATTTSALDKVSGARSFGALPRSVWAVGRDQASGQTVLAPVKANLIRQDEKKSVGFAIESSYDNPDIPVVAWSDEEVAITADELLGDKSGGARDEAGDWLREMLADGPMDSRELLEHAE